MQFRRIRGLTPSTFDIERVDEYGKAVCSFYGDETISDFEMYFQN